MAEGNREVNEKKPLGKKSWWAARAISRDNRSLNRRQRIEDVEVKEQLDSALKSLRTSSKEMKAISEMLSHKPQSLPSL